MQWSRPCSAVSLRSSAGTTSWSAQDAISDPSTNGVSPSGSLPFMKQPALKAPGPTLMSVSSRDVVATFLKSTKRLQEWRRKKSKLLVVGAGFIGVEWVTELQYYFPDLQLTIIDFLPRCLGPLPDLGAEYCEDYMQDVGIATFYGKKYDANNPEFMASIGFTEK